MTYNDLCKEIIALGFDGEIDSPHRVLTATRRSLNAIFTERPVYKTLSLYQRPAGVSCKIPVLEHVGGDTDTVKYKARAFSFISSGIGSYKISEAGEEQIYSFSGEHVIHRGFLHGEGKIEFFGEYSYSIYNLSVFDEIFGPEKEDIRVLSGYVDYDVTNYTDDFLSFAFAPKNEMESDIEGAVLRGNIMRIPEDYHGKISLIYKSRPKLVSGLAEEEIVLPSGTEHLLALLVSAYVWLDDDSEKAEYYMSLYREGMSTVKYYDRSQGGGTYQDVNGWA